MRGPGVPYCTGSRIEARVDIKNGHLKAIKATLSLSQHFVQNITIFVNLRFFWHFETVTNIRTWIKSHKYWRML